MTLEIRFYKRTQDCSTTGYILQTPFSDPEKAIGFAEGKFRKGNHKRWKLDKGFIKRQINERQG